MKKNRMMWLLRFLRASCLIVALGLCLFGPAQSLEGNGVIGPWLREIGFTFRDAGTQWMVYACLAVYFVTFLVIGERQAEAVAGRATPCAPFSTRARPTVIGAHGVTRLAMWGCNSHTWLVVGLVIAALNYAFDYTSASTSTEPLMLLGGVVLGKAASVWAGWVRRDTACAPGGGQGTARPTRTGAVVVVLTLLFLLACVWQAEEMQRFQYRGQSRWSGPWENPNIFGMLMGVGVVLAVGQVLLRMTELQHPTFNIQHPVSKWKTWQWGQLLFYLAAAGVMSVGLVRSYSRGAWLATAIGLAYLGCQAFYRQMRVMPQLTDEETRLTPSLSPQPMGGEGESSSRGLRVSRFAKFLRRNWIPLVFVWVASGVIAFWNYRHTEHVVARRAFSVGNVNDFSWRNRVTAWVGALQMIAEHPWLGVGWKQPEPLYDHYYRPGRLTEGAAIQLNSYFMLGMTLGLPALFGFSAYIAMSLKPRFKARRPESNVRSPASATLDSGLPTPGSRLEIVCRAAALVLLVAFFFDGGLFKLATGATFWILLELGREN